MTDDEVEAAAHAEMDDWLREFAKTPEFNEMMDRLLARPKLYAEMGRKLAAAGHKPSGRTMKIPMRLEPHEAEK